MSLNPIVFTKQILDTFLRYQRTAFPFSDPRLAAQAREMLGESLTSHLAKGPFVSLSRPFRLGATVGGHGGRGQAPCWDEGGHALPDALPAPGGGPAGCEGREAPDRVHGHRLG